MPLTNLIKNIAKLLLTIFLFQYYSDSAESIETLKSNQYLSYSSYVNKSKIFSDSIPIASPEVDTTTKTSCDFKVYFIDVGQGDSEFIQLPNCKTALIDGGPSASKTSKFVSFLKSNNINSIDYVVLTHPHADHFTGLGYVFDNLNVANFYDTKENNPKSSTLQKVREKAKNKEGLNIIYPSAGDTLNWDKDVSVKVLHSCDVPGESSQGDVLNNCSIVIKMTYQNTSILFMGDSEEEVEKELISKYGEELRADVIKVAHHGSATASSAEFLKTVKPKKAYIEVGKNSYGLPVTDIISRIESYGATVHRTDIEGTMEYSIIKAEEKENIPVEEK
ncbi:MAG: MBL fold metallo-hydrolase [Elusimicrobiota bacterium]